MGRNHRHKKDLRAEKAKVKLKQSKTKFLPKGLNVTNTNFKIKPIVLTEQLQGKDTDTPLSRRKLDIKDLLSRIKHYNETVRHSACEELSEMIKIHAVEIINNYVSETTLTISSLMQDREHKCRKSAVRAINTLLEITPEEKLKPFFSYFSTNLCCAMTNIDKNIQEDSLMFLDCFIKYTPRLISQSSEKLLPNFFTLISKLRNDSNLGRILTVNLGSKMTSVTWRIKVLSRLHAVLETILYKSVLGDKTEKIDAQENYKSVDNCNTFPMYKHCFSEVLDYPIMTYKNTQINFNGPDVLNRHIITLVPLLYETWIEVVPEKKIGKAVTENTILNEEASAILSCIMNILYLLWKYVKRNENDSINVKNVFLSDEGKKFLSHLLTNFPYCQTDKKTKKKKSSSMKILEMNYDPKCVRENLLICYMYCVISVHYLQNNLKIEMEAVTTYIIKCLTTKKYTDQSNINILTQFLEDCLVNFPQMWKRAGANLKSILESTITFYNQNLISEKYKPEIFNILLNVADVPFLNKCQQYNVWISSLPSLLCENSISDVLIDALLRLSRKNNEVFNKALLKALPTILDNLETLTVVLTIDSLNNNEETVKRNVVNIFFFLPILHGKHIEAIPDFIIKHSGSNYSIYFIDMLKLRLELKNNGTFVNDLRKCPFWKDIC